MKDTTDGVNPIVTMLSWKTRLLTVKDIQLVLAAVASIERESFMLKDVLQYLPDEMYEDKKKTRSISSLLNVLVDIGYLDKSSERKWTRTSVSLSHHLSPLMIELSEIEKRPFRRGKEEDKVVRFSSR